MLYSLSTGKVVDISIEQFLRMEDEDFQTITGLNYGSEIGNPFFGSVLLEGEFSEPKLPETIQEEIALQDIIETEILEDNETIKEVFDKEYFNEDELEE